MSASTALRNWAEKNHIGSESFFVQLDNIGAYEPNHLLDLSDEDLRSFETILKKLEYVRFEKGISELRNNKNPVDEFLSTEITIPSTLTGLSTSPSQNSHSMERFIDGFKEPPLPSTCPEKTCSGILSVSLGKRRNKYLQSIQGPDSRWLVDCSMCSTKWHACHFNCGHIQKIGSMGSSEIIRHEQGRYNKWQQKISPPCHKNPDRESILNDYQQKKQDSAKQTMKKMSKNKNDLQSGKLSQESTPVEKMPSLSFGMYRSRSVEADDEGFKNMIDQMAFDTADFDCEEEARLCPKSLETVEAKEPMPKKAKVEANPNETFDAIDFDPNYDMDELCDDVVSKCMLEKCKNMGGKVGKFFAV